MAITKEEKAQLINDFAKNDQDTGSAEVQVALLTKNIAALTVHCKKHKKDNSTRRGLLQMVCQRRRHLNYLSKNDQETYKSIIGRLGLKR